MHEMQYYYQEYFCLRIILNNNVILLLYDLKKIDKLDKSLDEEYLQR